MRGERGRAKGELGKRKKVRKTRYVDNREEVGKVAMRSLIGGEGLGSRGSHWGKGGWFGLVNKCNCLI